MAEYAEDRRCVRAAAQGFFPTKQPGMPGRKSSADQHSSILLEEGACFLQRKKGCTSQIIPGEFCWQVFQCPQKRKFLAKKRKKSRLFPLKVFCDCILKMIAVLYYGVFDFEILM